MFRAPRGKRCFTRKYAELAERSNDPFVLFNLGSIAVERLAVNGVGKGQFKKVSARWGRNALKATLKQESQRRVVTLEREIAVTPEKPLEVSLTA